LFSAHAYVEFWQLLRKLMNFVMYCSLYSFIFYSHTPDSRTIYNKKAVLPQGEPPRDAAVNFYTSRRLQRRRAVFTPIARLPHQKMRKITAK